MTLAALIDNELQKTGITQTQLANRTGISKSYLCNILSGVKKNVSPDKLFRIATVLEIDTTPLLEACGLDDSETEKRPIVVGISGPSCAGKTWLAKKLLEHRSQSSAMIDLDGYYHDEAFVEGLEYRNDNPNSFKADAAIADIVKLKAGQNVATPEYCFETHSVIGEKLCLAMPVIIVEGLFIYGNKSLRDEIDIKVWIQSGENVRFKRRLHRDVKERKRNLEEITERYMTDVVPGYNKYLAHLSQHADVSFLNDGSDADSNPLIVEMLWNHIEKSPMFKSSL